MGGRNTEHVRINGIAVQRRLIDFNAAFDLHAAQSIGECIPVCKRSLANDHLIYGGGGIGVDIAHNRSVFGGFLRGQGNVGHEDEAPSMLESRTSMAAICSSFSDRKSTGFSWTGWGTRTGCTSGCALALGQSVWVIRNQLRKDGIAGGIQSVGFALNAIGCQQEALLGEPEVAPLGCQLGVLTLGGD